MVSQNKKNFMTVLLILIGFIIFSTVSRAQIIWDMTVKQYEFKDNLETVVPSTQYDQSIVNVTYSNVAPHGNTYLLLDLEVNKTQGGNKPFTWQNLSVVDEAGNKYKRLANDSFLHDHKYTRMRGDELKLGKNSGYICVEIPANKAQQKLYLEYEFEGETLRREIK